MRGRRREMEQARMEGTQLRQVGVMVVRIETTAHRTGMAPGKNLRVKQVVDCVLARNTTAYEQ
jgi:hypothetical protein